MNQRFFVLSMLCAAALLVTPSVRGAFILTLTQVGNDVQITGSGTLNTSSLNLGARGYNNQARIQSYYAFLLNGPSSATITGVYTGAISGPTSFGSVNSSYVAGSGSGELIGIDSNFGNPILYAPNSAPGTVLTNTSVYYGATFASLGFTPGTYTFTWGTGVNADSLTVTGGVPEPSTAVLVGAGVAGLTGWSRRRCAHRA